MPRAAPAPKDNMGAPEPRLDGHLKVTGAARYGSDFPVRNPAYAYLVTSAVSKGRVLNTNTDAALSIPGVIEVFTYRNTQELKPVGFKPGGGGATSSVQDLGPDIHHDG